MNSEKFKPIICIDFDGVIHSYTSGWQGSDIVADDPVPYAIEWLELLIMDDRITPVIYSSRSKDIQGITAMRTWLLKHGMIESLLHELEFPTQKPAVFLTIDDRAICFTGKFPSIGTMTQFVPWNKK
jgi:hypothetical protein